jgi:hypothetical protein
MLCSANITNHQVLQLLLVRHTSMRMMRIARIIDYWVILSGTVSIYSK